MTTEPNILDLPRYVRVTGVLKNRFVEFDYSIGDPMMYVELVLPFDQFRQFCERENAQELTTDQKNLVDYDRLKWRFGEPGCKE